MPTCPGCERRVSYDRLDVHQRYCDGIRGADWIDERSIERLEHRLANVERLLASRFEQFETDVENRSSSLEETGRMK